MSFITMICLSQVVKTGASESSILFNNANLGIDITKTEASFSLVNYKDVIASRSSSLLWGINASGNLGNDIASVFKSSEIQPNSKFQGVLGYTFSNASTFRDFLDNEVSSLSKEKSTLYKSLDAAFFNNLINEVDLASVGNNIKNQAKAKIATIQSGANKFREAKKWVNERFQNSTGDESILMYKLYRFIEYNTELNNYLKIQPKIDRLLKQQEPNILKKKYVKGTIYSLIGFNGQQFNLLNPVDGFPGSFSIDKSSFTGRNFGLGLNSRIGGNFQFGFRYLNEESNNLNSLTKNEYKLVQSVNGQNGNVFTTETKKTAYSGTFDEVFINRFAIDVIKSFKMDDENIVLLDFYYRHGQSNNESNYVRRTDIGISASFFNNTGKFLGGIYLEVPDTNQNAEKRKPVDKQELEGVLNRLSFGVYAKFSFTSLLNLN